MRKTLFAIIAAALLLSACSKEAPVVEIASTAAPEQAAEPAGSAENRLVVFFPEEAKQGEESFMLTFYMPELPSAAMTAAIEDYEDELITKIESELLPYAERTGSFVPNLVAESTVFTASLPSGEYTNVMFTETVSFTEDGETEQERHVIVMDAEGNEQSLGSVSGVYFPESTVAQQIWNIIADDPAYYPDLTQEDIEGHLDLFNGFSVGDEGYTVYLPAGTVADESMGLQEFSFGQSALYPDFVGDTVSAEDYEELLPLLKAAAAEYGPQLTQVSPDYGFYAEDAVESTEGTLLVSGMLMSGLPGSAEAASIAAATAEFSGSSGSFALVSFEIM